MSNFGQSIEEVRVKQFGSGVYHLSQQKISKLRGLVSFDSFVGKSKFYDRMGGTEVYEKTGRYSDTQWQDVEWSRRRLTFRDYRWAHPVDGADKLRMIHSPESEVAKAARFAFGRKMDEIIIGAALGISYAGEEGGVQVALPDSQKVAAHDGAGFSRLSLDTLKRIREKYWENEAIIGEEDAIEIVCTGKDIMALLDDDQITGADYATVKALVNGTVNSFMGFNFHRIDNLLPQTTAALNFDLADGSVGAGAGVVPAGSNRCFAFVKEGIQMAMNEDVMARVDERPDKDYINQVYMKMAMGGTRMEEVKVVEIFTAK
jgi:hypothetical protein